MRIDYELWFLQRLELRLRSRERRKGIRPPPLSKTVFALPDQEAIAFGKKPRRRKVGAA